jgi:NAD+ synthase
MIINCEAISSRIEKFIREKVAEFQRDGVVLGMSGGIDSSLVGTLAVRALGSEKVLALMLPERDSSPSSKTDALKVIKELKIDYREINLTPILSTIGIYKMMPLQFLGLRSMKEAVVRESHRHYAEKIQEMPFRAGLLGTKGLGEAKEVINAGNAYTRAKHRVRLLILYYIADLENRLVLGTTNKSESKTGFVVKWGDNVADIEPILPLYKTQVRQLSEYLGIHQDIIDKAPSPDLMPGIVDEFALGVDYETLDQILWALEQGWAKSQIESTYAVELDLVEYVAEMSQRSQHLREFPPEPQI